MCEGCRGVGRREGAQERENEGLTLSSWIKTREGYQGKRFLESGSHCGVSKKPRTRETPRKPQG